MNCFSQVDSQHCVQENFKNIAQDFPEGASFLTEKPKFDDASFTRSVGRKVRWFGDDDISQPRQASSVRISPEILVGKQKHDASFHRHHLRSPVSRERSTGFRMRHLPGRAAVHRLERPEWTNQGSTPGFA